MNKKSLLSKDFWEKKNNLYQIIGPAGCGKTHTIKNFVKKNSNKNGIIITYTNNAVAELKNRIYNKVEINTIHAWVWSILKKMQDVLIEEIKKNEIIQKNYAKYKMKKIETVSYQLGYNYYNEEKNEINISHNLLIQLFCNILKNNINLFKILDTYDYIIIDEFQDTNNEVLKLLLEYKWTKSKIMLFGDKMQQIYDQNEIETSQCETIYLNKNYRSKKNIVEFCHKFRNDKNSFDAESKSEEIGIIEIINDEEIFKKYQSLEDWENIKLTKNGFFSENNLKTISKEVNFFNKRYAYPKESKILNKNANERDEITNFMLDLICLQKDDITEESFVKKYLQWNKNADQIIEINRLKNVINIFKACKCFNTLHKNSNEILSKQIKDDICEIWTEINESHEKSNMIWEYYEELFEFINNKKSTMHGSKGLEYDNVLIDCRSNWNKYKFNKNTLFNGNTKESKLFYVSISRAKNNLIIYTDNNEIFEELQKLNKF